MEGTPERRRVNTRTLTVSKRPARREAPKGARRAGFYLRGSGALFRGATLAGGGARPDLRIEVMIPARERLAVFQLGIARRQKPRGMGPERIGRIVAGPAVADGAAPAVGKVAGRVMNAAQVIGDDIAGPGIKLGDIVFVALALDVGERLVGVRFAVRILFLAVIAREQRVLGPRTRGSRRRPICASP